MDAPTLLITVYCLIDDWLAGGTVLPADNKGRLATRRGVANATLAKAALTGLTLAATAYSRA